MSQSMNRMDSEPKLPILQNGWCSATNLGRDREENFGAGDGDRTRDVQLGNFLLKMIFSIL